MKCKKENAPESEKTNEIRGFKLVPVFEEGIWFRVE
jgi:hypothetical protein